MSNGPKQKRFHEMELKFPKDRIPTEISVKSNMEVTFSSASGIVEPIYANVKLARDRVNKSEPKVLGKITLDPESLVADATTALGRYDMILAVDTNTKEINGEMVSVCCVVKCKLDFRQLPEYSGRFWPDACFEFRNATKPYEPISWEIVLRGVASSRDFNQLSCVGIVVDSELGKLEGINNRTEPVRSNYFLPDKCELVYASDKGREWLGSPLIKTCDRISSVVMDLLESAPPSENSLQHSRTDFIDRFRHWDISSTKDKDVVHIKVSPREH